MQLFMCLSQNWLVNFSPQYMGVKQLLALFVTTVVIFHLLSASPIPGHSRLNCVTPINFVFCSFGRGQGLGE